MDDVKAMEKWTFAMQLGYGCAGGAVGCDGELRVHSIRRKTRRQAYGSDSVNLEPREASVLPPVR